MRKLRQHVISCPAWAELYRTDRDRALDPAEEYARWEEQERGAERDRRVKESIAEVDAQRAAMADRFAKPRDILEEE